MRRRSILLWLAAQTVGTIASSIFAHAGSAWAQVSIPDENADVVHVRVDCTVDGAALPNCVESLSFLSDDQNGWLWHTRRPNAFDRVTLQLGPGRFTETFECPDFETNGSGRTGFVSVVGAGREGTVMAAVIQNCESLDFSALTLSGPAGGVFWLGGGSATWSDVDILGQDAAVTQSVGWWDYCGSDGETSTQRFHGARIQAFGNQPGSTVPSAAYISSCAQSTFYGGDLQLRMGRATNSQTDPASPLFGRSGVASLNGAATLELYGVSVRAGSSIPLSSGTGEPNTLYGVTLTSNHLGSPTFRMHGGIVSMNASGAAQTNLVGLRVTGDPRVPIEQSAYANTMGSAFVMNPSGTGVADRLRATDARIDAPLLWQPGPNPPSSANGALGSLAGQGLFVETDCDADGGCETGGQAHLMVYDGSCSAAGNGPWRNMMTGACRGVDPTP